VRDQVFVIHGSSAQRCMISETGIPLRHYALDPGFMAFQLVRRTRIVMLMMPM